MGAGLKVSVLVVCTVIFTVPTKTFSMRDSAFGLSFDEKQFVNNLGRELDEAFYRLSLLEDTGLLKDTLSSISCKDSPREARLCPIWKKYGQCKHRVWMRRYCAKTCDICTPPAPPIPVLPECAKTTFGCCWDNKTVAKGPVEDFIASQCSPCMDRQSKSFCVEWSDKCNSTIIGQGDVMRERCATTCGTPCDYSLNIHKSKCQDDAAYRQSCFQWFTEGKCTTETETMKVLCPDSCRFCRRTNKFVDHI